MYLFLLKNCIWKNNIMPFSQLKKIKFNEQNNLIKVKSLHYINYLILSHKNASLKSISVCFYKKTVQHFQITNVSL